MFNEKFGPKASFTTDFKEFPFVNLSDVIKENGHKTLKVQAVYTFKPKKGDNAGKDVPVLVADGLNIYTKTSEFALISLPASSTITGQSQSARDPFVIIDGVGVTTSPMIV